MNITKGRIPSAQKVLIYGPEGIGKSTFAAQFPGPLFVDTEGSTKHLDVARLDPPTSWSMLLAEVAEVKASPGCCQTLVIDTADWAERLCIEHVCSKGGKAGIEDFGYGKGYTYVAEEFGRLLNLLSDLIARGVNVVLTAHATIYKFEQPEESGSYDRWELNLIKKKTAPMVKQWADMVLFANYKTIVATNKDGKVKAQGGKRVIYTSHHPNWDAKNRHGLADELPFEYASIASAIPNMASAPAMVSDAPASTPTPAQPVPQTAPQPMAHPAAQSAAQPASQPAAAAPSSAPQQPSASAAVTLTSASKPLVFEEVMPDYLQPLFDLMKHDNINELLVRQVAANRGYKPFDMPLAAWDKEFVEGWAIACWSQIKEAAEKLKPYGDIEIPFR
ncbi:MAG: ATP-binding protein [Coriobacteriales bacterium]|jgi:hypothetical protein|nr:ATP-binding protein [Coriobacteriales bacterium]